MKTHCSALYLTPVTLKTVKFSVCVLQNLTSAVLDRARRALFPLNSTQNSRCRTELLNWWPVWQVNSATNQQHYKQHELINIFLMACIDWIGKKNCQRFKNVKWSPLPVPVSFYHTRHKRVSTTRHCYWLHYATWHYENRNLYWCCKVKTLYLPVVTFSVIFLALLLCCVQSCWPCKLSRFKPENLLNWCC